jgi:hypothetical protein
MEHLPYIKKQDKPRLISSVEARGGKEAGRHFEIRHFSARVLKQPLERENGWPSTEI